MELAQILPATLGGYIAAFLATVFVYLTASTIYSLFFHPLAKFPGPKLAATTNLWFILNWTSGSWALSLQKTHKKYGDVVRIKPNELSFASAESYKDIYGHAAKGRSSFLKSEFYEPSHGNPPSVVDARDPADHRLQRKALSSAFSAKALREQEGVVHKYVDMFIKQIGKLGGPATGGLNAPESFNWLTFDIIGDLAFGESFNAVENGKTHPWVSVIVEATYWSTIIDHAKRMPLMSLLMPFLVHRDISKDFEMHNQLTKEKTLKRIQQKDSIDREDFFQHILKKENWSTGKLESNAELLIIAGSETTATTMSGIAYFLSKNPDCMTQLQNEVLGSFSSYEDINGDSTAKLPYLNAVIEEALRLYPPVPFGLPRVSPGATVSGHYVPAGTVVSTQNWTPKHDPRYWHDADSFRPERWIGDGFGDRKDAFNPFSLGPRVCLGINLAYLELRIILAKMVWQYEWELVDKDVDWVKDNKMYALWQKPTMKMRFHSRTEVKA